MLAFIENYLLSRGFNTLRLNVARANDLAERMYEKHGFRILGLCCDGCIWMVAVEPSQKKQVNQNGLVS